MNHKLIKTWKKVFENDLSYVLGEFKETIPTPAVIIIDGDLGAGKTTFVRNFADAKLEVSSPTYSVIQEYHNFAHADFYRIEDSSELIHLELETYSDEKDYFFIEWGGPYIKEIQETIGEEFKYFMLEISVNELVANGQEFPSRNYNLREI